jgi:hypothetical protein
MPLAFDPNRPDYHALYDAGLLDATIATSSELTYQFSQPGDHFDTNALRAWRVPWCIVPTQQTDVQPTLDDYRIDLAGKITKVLQTKNMLNGGSPSRDINAFVHHWSYLFLKEAAYLHGKTPFQEKMFPHENAELLIRRVREPLRGIALKSGGKGTTYLVADSPAHPEWNNYKSKPVTSEQGSSVKVLAVSGDVRLLTTALLGNQINMASSTSDVASDVMREAGECLLSVNRDYIAEIDSPERKALQEFCMQHRNDPDISEQDRHLLFDLVSDLWVHIDEDSTIATSIAHEINALEGGNLPSIEDGPIPDLLNIFIVPYLDRPEAAAELERRLPILKFIAMRSLMEENADSRHVDIVIDALNRLFRTCRTTSRWAELYMHAHNLRKGKATIERLMYSL